jgi:VanZ family protein
MLAALAAAVTQIRHRRGRRYGAILAAFAIAAAYSIVTAAENPESRAVERFHFLEYGVIAFLFYRAWRPLGDPAIVLLPMLAGVLAGTAEEWFQWFIPRRVGELRDVFLNLVAIGCGLLFSVAVLPPPSFRRRLRRGSAARVCRLAAATVLALAAFVHALHLGHAVRDEEAGTFTSRYSAAQLRALQAGRQARWRTDPPPLTLQRLSREDQYLSEGIEHVMHRNELWAAGDYAGAWNENLILERYFAPVLDTPSYAGRAGHRWPAEQRADAEARVNALASFEPAAYVSGAYPYPILVWNAAAFWTVVALVTGALAALAVRFDRAEPADTMPVDG